LTIKAIENPPSGVFKGRKKAVFWKESLAAESHK
jgi:hypothetical protein